MQSIDNLIVLKINLCTTNISSNYNYHFLYTRWIFEWRQNWISQKNCVKCDLLWVKSKSIFKVTQCAKLGKPVSTKTDEFLENFRRGGGGHFRSKKFHCNFFCIRNGNFGHEFLEKTSKRGGSFPI